MSTVLKELSSGLIFAKIKENDKISNIDDNNVLKLYYTNCNPQNYIILFQLIIFLTIGLMKAILSITRGFNTREKYGGTLKWEFDDYLHANSLDSGPN